MRPDDSRSGGRREQPLAGRSSPCKGVPLAQSDDGRGSFLRQLDCVPVGPDREPGASAERLEKLFLHDGFMILVRSFPPPGGGTEAAVSNT